MENIQVLRYIANLESRIKNLENNSSGFVTSNNLVNSIIPQSVDLTDVNNRIANLESRPDVMQRLSALELTVASLNSSS